MHSDVASTPADRAHGAAHLGGDDVAFTEGEVVWHHTNGPGLLSILDRHCLWATAAPFLNDQQEVALGGDLIVRRLDELAQGSDADEVYVEMAARVREGLRDGHGPSAAAFHILSASRTWDSLVMWRNYGGSRESYAIGLDASAPLQVLGDPEIDPTAYGWSPGGVAIRRTAWEPVRYTESDQLALVDAVLDDLPGQMRRLRDHVHEFVGGPGSTIDPGERPAARPELPADLEAEFGQTRDDLEQALLLIKHRGFVDEREVRKAIVLWSDESEAARESAARLIRYRSTAYGMAPYVELTGASDDHPVARHPSPLPIRAVAISPSPNGPEATESLRGLLASRGYAGTPVLRSVIPFRG
ncbi:hypothetical protein [Knoellia subterranea]|uniref:DUF2971 domain-containing protein n=1 Tax=Knoellia subterranea KCTC 19937 TaxID=1385521 RepID=A0A0A0JKM3_9MICO|nr:hypothetical protein [Knoellia subterranea]KGN36196.1 hypothetical protein N803_04870 [Knoellia subterranea KCTC 19937]